MKRCRERPAPRAVVVAGAGASAWAGLPTRLEFASREYASFERARCPKARAEAAAALRERYVAALSCARARWGCDSPTGRAAVALSRYHQVVVATCNVDGLLKAELQQRIPVLELHGSIRDASTLVLEGEGEGGYARLRTLLAEAAVVLVVGLSDYTTSITDLLATATAADAEIFWVNPERSSVEAMSRRSLHLFEGDIGSFLERPPARWRALVGGPGGRTRAACVAAREELPQRPQVHPRE